MTKQKFTTMNTVQGTFDRCQAEGIGISKNLIRQLALSGEIPSVKVGKSTRLIHWEQLMQFLYDGTPQETADITPDKIRRVEVR